MRTNIQTVNLFTDETRTAADLLGKRAVWETFEGDLLEGVVESNPFGTAFPVVRFDDGTFGQTGGVVEVIID